jgi:TatD DNase family protein
MQFTDTHCHIHEAAGSDDVAARWHKAGNHDPVAILEDSRAAGVTRIICVGCTLADTKLAVDFAGKHDGVWASIGIHPHEAKLHADDQAALDEFAALAATPKVVAVGECGLDYFYTHSPKKEQEAVLRFQLEIAQKHNLPLIFHVREAFDDFWPIFDEYKDLRGVVHSFSATVKELEQILQRGLYVGLNGIMTFTKNPEQLAAAKLVPNEQLLLETDAPFLTPHPYRGSICEPKHVRVTAEFLAGLRGQRLEDLAEITTANARRLFGL